MTINSITPFEHQIRELIHNSLDKLGYKLVRVKLLSITNSSKKSKASKTLQIMIERLDNEDITVSDCEKASHTISALLDVEDIILDNYNLEISSPGIDRPLMTIDDFIQYQGFEVKLSLSEKVDGIKQLKGTITEVNDDTIKIKMLNNREIYIDFLLIIAAKLVLNNQLIKKNTKI